LRRYSRLRKRRKDGDIGIEGKAGRERKAGGKAG